MDSKVIKISAARPRSRTYYERWIEQEGVPIIEGFGVTDVRKIPLKKSHRRLPRQDRSGDEPRARTSSLRRGHLYSARRRRGRDAAARPGPSEHRLASRQPVFAAVKCAPSSDKLLQRAGDFSRDHHGTDGARSLSQRADFFAPRNERYLASNNRQWVWETNFIPDVRKAQLDAQEQKGAGVNITQFEISSNTLIGHLAEWPVGRYHKAHYHGGGAVLVILRSEGYSLMWPNDVGTKPYASGQGDRVVRVDWTPGSVFSPPTNWFHQHFNSSAEPARYLALKILSRKYKLQPGKIQSDVPLAFGVLYLPLMFR